MVKTIRTNLLLTFFMLFSLSCDDESQVINSSEDNNNFYCMSMTHFVAGGDGVTDFTAPGDGDYLLEIKLQSSSDASCSGNLQDIEGATLSFDWIINDGASLTPPLPYLETVPSDGTPGASLYQNSSTTTNADGIVRVYWKDAGYPGCIKLYCDYLDSDGNIVTSLEDPEPDCSSATDNDNNPFQIITQAAAFENSEIRSFELELTPGLIIYNDIEDNNTDGSEETSVQTNSDLTIEATVLDAGGAGIQNVPVNFINESTGYGILTSSQVLTNQLGQATTTLVEIDTDNIGNQSSIALQIKAEVYDETGNPVSIQIDNDDPADGLFNGPNDVDLTLSRQGTATLIPQSLNNISNVADLDVWFVQSLNLEYNVNVALVDTISAKVVDSDNTPIENVPITFTLRDNELSSEPIGSISSSNVLTNSEGVASIYFQLTPADVDDNASSVDVSIDVSAGDSHSLTLNRTYIINNSSNIEYDVNEFHYFPVTTNSVTAYALPQVENPGSYQGIERTLPMVVRNANGVVMEGVPVQFAITGSSSRSNGSLSTALAYTCCDDGSSSSDSSEGSDDSADDGSGEDTGDSSEQTTTNNQFIDWNGDGQATVDENRGIAYVTYSNSVIGSSDDIKAFIVDPEDQTNNLFEENFTITTNFIDELASSLDNYATPASINVEQLDSAYCSQVVGVAKDASGMSLENIPMQFSIDSNDIAYGLITTNYAITELDTSYSYEFFTAKTTFCTYPNINFNNQTIDVDITSTIPNNSSISSSNLQLNLTENLPECPGCEEALTLTAEYVELPARDQNQQDVFTSLMTATLVDSSEQPVDENTLVQFSCLEEILDAEGVGTGQFEQIGNIDPIAFTGVDLSGQPNGIATATFNMGNDVGLAQIIAYSPQYNLADTAYINLTSTNAAYIEIIQPFPNEIMVQGGGGLESTEIEVEVKDGNGNLVSEPYLVYFKLKSNAPNGSYLNDESENNQGEYWCVESSNGTASVTLNAGTAPGSVPILAELHELALDDDCSSLTPPVETVCANITPGATWDHDCDGNTPVTSVAISDFDSVPVTILTGSPHSGEINFSYVDITPIGGGLYEVPLSIQIEDEWANPVADSTNVYLWIEDNAPPFDFIDLLQGAYSTNDTTKWGIETSTNVIDMRDSLSYVLLTDRAGLPPVQSPNADNFASTGGLSNTLGTPDSSPSACNCYKDELFNQCGNGVGGTLCTWEVIPTQSGQIIGEAKTGMLSPNNESYPGVAWSSVYYGTSDMFARTVIKAMTYDQDGEVLLIDSRNNHSGEPLVLPFQPGSISVSPSLVFWDFGTMGQASEAVEPDWVNDASLTDATSAGITVTATITDFYQYGVDNGILLLSAPGSVVDETYDGPGLATGRTYDWIACNPVDTDGDGNTGTCSDPNFDNNCSECVANLGTWTPDTDANGPNGTSWDDNQSLCITNSSGQCSWIIHYSETLTPEEGGGGGAIGGDATFADFTSTLSVTLQNPLITVSAGVDIRLEKNPAP